TDTVIAAGAAGASTLSSNAAVVHWSTGKHVTFLALNLAPTSGIVGTSVVLTATLSDVSVTPGQPIAGASVHFSLGAAGCDAVTNSGGIAACSVTPPAGQLVLTAT